jgi:hypothetical protein
MWVWSTTNKLNLFYLFLFFLPLVTVVSVLRKFIMNMAVKTKSMAPPALRKDGGFELLPTGEGRMKFFARSVQPSSKSLLKKYGISVRADPITVSSFSNQKMELVQQPENASDLTSGESSENEASHFDGNHLKSPFQFSQARGVHRRHGDAEEVRPAQTWRIFGDCGSVRAHARWGGAVRWGAPRPPAAAPGPRRVPRPHARCLPRCLRCPGTRVRRAWQEGLGLSHGPHFVRALPLGGGRPS